MTSIASRSDVEDAMVRAGIRAPHVRAQLMRVIDFYVAGKLHGHIPDIPEAHPGLLPGESDFESEVTRCLKCGETKRWAQFAIDRSADSKHGDICRSCEKGGDDEIPGDLFLTCHGPCGERKHATQFYRARGKSRGFGYKCKACLGISKDLEDGEPGAREYRCRRCGEDKPLEEFPLQKRTSPMGTFPCIACLDKGGDGVTRKWKCLSCGQTRKSHYFPRERQENPRLRLNCISCGN
jgi:hypothetical protein